MKKHTTSPAALLTLATEWWTTSIIDISPGVIRPRGIPIQDLIGAITFPQMIWLMLRGSLPEVAQARLLEAALVSAVDHGPQAPSIAISRMAVTCGLSLNGAMASAINVLDDVHGGAGEQALELYARVQAVLGEEPGDLAAAVDTALDEHIASVGKMVPGFGHRFHPVDPRVAPLLALVDEATKNGIVSGVYARIGRATEAALKTRNGRPIPMNVDGVTAVVYGELGFPPPLARGLFILSRSVGILAHAWEQTEQGERIKGPMPPQIAYRYTGPNAP
ncbi:MAG TPA: citryl-CoA lyase [Acidobacteriaceae bacterium]|nr:citryl-CoA lyase [Acidobacteriaceae bacterium]